jgi:hypothetical protein
MSENKNLYGHKEHVYAEAFANALRDDPDFLKWVLGQTPFAGRDGVHVIWDEMITKRPKAKFWWKNYWTGSCKCLGCSGSETDVFVALQDVSRRRFALHIEVKQPTDRFDPAKRQGERYSVRAACWARAAPATVPVHAEAGTIILCSETKRVNFTAEIQYFDACITFEEIARTFPNATVAPA